MPNAHPQCLKKSMLTITHCDVDMFVGSFFLVYNPDLLFTREVFPAGGTHVHPSKLTSYKALEAQ